MDTARCGCAWLNAGSDSDDELQVAVVVDKCRLLLGVVLPKLPHPQAGETAAAATAELP